MKLSPIALKIKEIIDGSYIAHKRGRRFRIKEHEIVDILNAVTELENGAKPPIKFLKKGDPGYEEWLDSLPTSKANNRSKPLEESTDKAPTSKP